MVFPELDLSIFELGLGVVVTGRCNQRCKHCYVIDNLPKTDLSLELFRKAFQDYPKRTGNLIPRIFLTGGEPTLHPDFKEFVLFASKISQFVTINTNAMTMPLDYNELKRKYDFLPGNVGFKVSFDNFHYVDLSDSQQEQYELRLLNLLKFCLVEKVPVTLLSVRVNGKAHVSKLRNAELLELLRSAYQRQPGLINFALTDLHQADYVKRKDLLRENEVYDSEFSGVELLNDGKVYGYEYACLDSQNKEWGYLGDISKESIESILTRLKRKLLTRRSRLFFEKIKEIMGSRDLSLLERKIFEIVARRVEPRTFRSHFSFDPFLRKPELHTKPK